MMSDAKQPKPDWALVVVAWFRLRRTVAVLVVAPLCLLYWRFRLSDNEWFSAITEDFGSALLAWLFVTVTFLLRLPEFFGFQIPRNSDQAEEAAIPATGLVPADKETGENEKRQKLPIRTSNSAALAVSASANSISEDKRVVVDSYQMSKEADFINLPVDVGRGDDLLLPGSDVASIDQEVYGIVQAVVTAWHREFGLSSVPRYTISTTIKRVSKTVPPDEVLKDLQEMGLVTMIDHDSYILCPEPSSRLSRLRSDPTKGVDNVK